MNPSRLFAFALVLFAALPAHAFNALGHKTIAALAWHELPPTTQAHIVATLRRHPRFDEDFAKRQPAGLAEADEGEWIFQHAATWPDLARGLPGETRHTYDRPSWHYVNFPIFHKAEPPLLNINLSPDYPTPLDKAKWNIIQAVKACDASLRSKAPPSEKALAYCWLFHLIGDAHQPLHSSALFSDRFPTGDRGGNLIETVQGGNLHSLWDDLLGQSHNPNDVKREVAELRQRPRLFKVEAANAATWIQESHELAKAFVYSPEILAAVEPRGELPKVRLSPEYLRGAGEHARARIAAAGVRLAAVLNALPISEADYARAAELVKAKPTPRPEPTTEPVKELDFFADAVSSTTPSTAKPAMGYWLNQNGNVRHNSNCRWYENTKRGQACSADEGRPCGICGG